MLFDDFLYNLPPTDGISADTVVRRVHRYRVVGSYLGAGSEHGDSSSRHFFRIVHAHRHVDEDRPSSATGIKAQVQVHYIEQDFVTRR